MLLGAAAPAQAALTISVESNRADLVAGGDALVAVTTPAGADRSALRVAVGGRDVSTQLQLRGADRVSGVITGLQVGANVVTARLGDDHAKLTITNHDTSGPIFAGPQVQPWNCAAGTRPPACVAPTTVQWWYMSATRLVFLPYDPKSPPASALVAKTTASTGETVPYVVRVEKGSMDRWLYAIAVLADPAATWSRWADHPGWNHKVMWPFGGGSNPDYRQEPAPSVLDDNALSHGYMVALNSLNVHGNNLNDVVSAEALMMLKEHIIETYGDIRWGIGEGCSGGGIQQYMLASMYPGLLDGIMPSCSFPDFVSETVEIADCRLLNHYFGITSPGLWPDPLQQNAVRGKADAPGCLPWDATYTSLLEPHADNAFKNCGLNPGQVYNAQTNAKGARCTWQDYQVAIWGRRDSDGFAKRPYDNVGVQYGLAQLRSGRITPAQFVDLNAKVGGLDIDANVVSQRSVADPGTLDIAYRTAQVSDPRQWAKVPIIDIRGHSTLEWHQDYNSYQARARLDAVNGNHDNHVIWTGAAPIVADPALTCSTSAQPPQEQTGVTVPIPVLGCSANPLLAMDRWLTRIHADDSTSSVERKVARNRPSDVTDACWAAGVRIDDGASCRTLYPYTGAPRNAAEAPMAGDILKCTLKPLRRSDYGVAFSEDEWATLQRTFPTGACDWSQPGVDQQPAVPWTTFAAGPGGRPLGTPPRSVVVRSCTSNRRFTIRLKRLDGRVVRTLKARVGTRAARVIRRRGGYLVTVDLRGRPRGTVRVTLTGRTGSGRIVTATRRYRTCVTRT